MAFVSEVLRKTITDIDGTYIGILEDLIARDIPEMIHPRVEAIQINCKGNMRIVPVLSAMSIFAPAVPLKFHIDDLPEFELDEDKDIYLARDVLDMQIIDTDGGRVVRVNDLQIIRVQGAIYVTNVDVGLNGIIRRTPAKKLANSLLELFKIKMKENFIAWDNVELLIHDQFMRLKVPKESMADLHPADIAEILSDLNKLETSQFLDALDVEQVADALEQVETDFQVSLIESMDDERAADVLDEMDPDEAADLLQELPEERSQLLVSLMQKSEADDVKLLLEFDDDTAGGIMTTEFATVPENVTAAQAINILREKASDFETLHYIYVTDELNHLLGVFSLKELLFASPKEKVAQLMEPKVRHIRPDLDQDEVAKIITKYDLLAVPVVNQQDVIIGIVTADDALDKIIPTAWKKRLPKFYH